MEKEIVEVRIKEIIGSLLELETKPEDIGSEENLIEMIGLNSVEALELLLMLEDEFQIEIDDDDLDETLVSCVRSLAEYIIEKKGAGE